MEVKLEVFVVVTMDKALLLGYISWRDGQNMEIRHSASRMGRSSVL